MGRSEKRRRERSGRAVGAHASTRTTRSSATRPRSWARASARSSQITELAGCDLLTISPDLLQEARRQQRQGRAQALAGSGRRTRTIEQDRRRRNDLPLPRQRRRDGDRKARRRHPHLRRRCDQAGKADRRAAVKRCAVTHAAADRGRNGHGAPITRSCYLVFGAACTFTGRRHRIDARAFGAFRQRVLSYAIRHNRVTTATTIGGTPASLRTGRCMTVRIQFRETIMTFSPTCFSTATAKRRSSIYRQQFGAEVTFKMRFKDAPPDRGHQPRPTRGQDHARDVSRSGRRELDGLGRPLRSARASPNDAGFSLSIAATTPQSGETHLQRARRRRQVADAVAIHVLDARASACSTDRFGVPWMVNVPHEGEAQAGLSSALHRFNARTERLRAFDIPVPLDLRQPQRAAGPPAPRAASRASACPASSACSHARRRRLASPPAHPPPRCSKRRRARSAARAPSQQRLRAPRAPSAPHCAAYAARRRARTAASDGRHHFQRRQHRAMQPLDLFEHRHAARRFPSPPTPSASATARAAGSSRESAA